MLKTITPFIIIVLALLISPILLFSQTSTNHAFLADFAEKMEQEETVRYERIKDFIRTNESIVKQSNLEIYDIIDGTPATHIPLGIEQVESSMAQAIWPVGDLGINLNGDGYNKVGMWTSYRSLPYIHEEYSDRIEYKDFHEYADFGYPIEEWPQLDDHDTQTAGIIIAGGSPNPDAKGVAYKSILNVYTGQRMESELAIAASEGMELASHSYGYANNCYGATDQIIDIVSYNAPNFLFIQAAGNTETELYGQGKNNLAVGSVRVLSGQYTGPSDVINGGSKIGPAVDYRIKPDIVAPGGPTTGCIGTDGYTTIGPFSSFAAPVVTGVGVLLQQHFQTNNSNGLPMRSSELKALMIHTTDEAGPADGPDAEFGWGLINAKRAAELITLDAFNQDVLTTHVLNEGGTFERQIYSDGTEPLRVTIVWTDPAGEIRECSDGFPRLVNDIDLSLTDGNITYFPYRLDSRNPTGPAFNNGKNFLDNVEQVYLPTSQEGYYTININHVGILTNSSQAFSMIVTGDTEEPSLINLRSEKVAVLEDLRALYPTTNNRVDWRLNKAINFLNWSLADLLWEDENYLTQYGAAVFNREMVSINYLNWIVKDTYSNIIKTESLEAIIALVDIDRQLAQLLIDKAVANNGNNQKIERAISAMEAAQAFVNQEKYYRAVNRYKLAWWLAHRSLVLVGLAKEASNEEFAEATLVDERISSFELGDNYPNPFNPTTEISYQVPEPSEVHITIYNLLGERITQLVNEYKDVGNYTIRWNGTDNMGNQVSNGVYLYELRAGGFKQVKRMSFIK